MDGWVDRSDLTRRASVYENKERAERSLLEDALNSVTRRAQSYEKMFVESHQREVALEARVAILNSHADATMELMEKQSEATLKLVEEQSDAAIKLLEEQSEAVKIEVKNLKDAHHARVEELEDTLRKMQLRIESGQDEMIMLGRDADHARNLLDAERKKTRGLEAHLMEEPSVYITLQVCDP